jgi:membrane protein required for colicin V production
MNIQEAQLSMNIFDAIILGVLGLSALVAFFRGFVREILSLGAWVGAAIITIYLFPESAQLAKKYVKSEQVAAGGAALGTYICALITLSLINSVIIRYIKTGEEVGIIDNLIGLLFGGIRGVFIVSLAFLIMSAVVPKENPPVWLKTSITKPYLQEGAQILAKIAPRYLSNLEEIVKEQQDRDREATLKDDIALPDIDVDKKAYDAQTGARKTFQNMMNGVQPKEGSKNDQQ